MRRVPEEPVVFVRIFLGTTGAMCVVSGLYLTGIVVLRQLYPTPQPLPLPRSLTVVMTFAFVFSVFCQGIAWVMVSLSERLWKSTS
jgi:apolipoprotein N-acyltransferase